MFSLLLPKLFQIITKSKLLWCLLPVGEVECEGDVKSIVPDGAAEQDRVLEDDGQPRPEGLQRQFGDVNVIDDDPPCERQKN